MVSDKAALIWKRGGIKAFPQHAGRAALHRGLPAAISAGLLPSLPSQDEAAQGCHRNRLRPPTGGCQP